MRSLSAGYEGVPYSRDEEMLCVGHRRAAGEVPEKVRPGDPVWRWWSQ